MARIRGFAPLLIQISTSNASASLHATKRIDQQGMPRPLRLFEQECRSNAVRLPPCRPRNALRNFRYFQDGINFRANPLQLPFFLQLPHKLRKSAYATVFSCSPAL